MNVVKKMLANPAIKELIDGMLLLKNMALRAATYIGNSINLTSNSILDQIIPRSNTEHVLLLVIFGIAMLLIRIIPVYSTVFTNWPGEHGNYVNFAADDAVYHMRLVHNTLQHYPWRIFFDPFSYFPYGMQIIFCPLFTYLVATTALIIGFGHPSAELVNHVSAYIPPALAVLCLIPVYLLTRQIFGKTPAIISAFILAFLPGEFLQRSTLGFIDHHVAEVLFSTTLCMFLIVALATFRVKPDHRRPALVYGLCGGMMLGAFILTWQGAMLFGAIFLVFLLVQLAIDHLSRRDTKYLIYLASLTYLPPMLILLPYAISTPLAMLPACNLPILIITFAIFNLGYVCHLMLKRRQFTPSLIFALLGLGALIVLVATASWSFFGAFKDFHNTVSTYGALTISEVRSAIIGPDGKFTLRIFWQIYLWVMPLSLLGLCGLGVRVCQKQHPEELFFLIWSLVMIAMTCKQIRFNYYLAINAAILAGYAAYFLFKSITFTTTNIKKQQIKALLLLCFMAFLLVYPIYLQLKHNQISAGAHINREWYNVLIWLKTHTPDPQGSSPSQDFNYNGYYATPRDLTKPFAYPSSAYGVMTWWDEGHQITYIAHRIPNANPHQQGVVDKTHTLGSAPFFTSTDEATAVNNLNTLGSRYVIVNKDMATAKFHAIAIWSDNQSGWTAHKNINIGLSSLPGKQLNFKLPIDSQKFSQSIISRLFYDDANGLQHFRLIYESDGGYYLHARVMHFLNPQFTACKFSTSELYMNKYSNMFESLAQRHKISSINHSKDTFIYFVRPPVKLAKIFEKVAGAVITGKVANNISDQTPVKLTLHLITKDQRPFIYEQTTQVTQGSYSFIVPYPTTKMSGADYNYDIQPVGNYQLQINGRTSEVAVPEAAVMLGQTIIAT